MSSGVVTERAFQIQFEDGRIWIKRKKRLQQYASAIRKEPNTVFNQGPHGCLATAETNLAAFGQLVLRTCLKPIRDNRRLSCGYVCDHGTDY